MTAETIEGEAVEVEPTRALVVTPDQAMTSTGAMALAELTDEEFERRLSALEKGRDRVGKIQRALMVKDVDYGVIPGTGTKPTLLKPGAEKLCQAYGLVANFTPRRSVGDGVAEPHLSYLTRCDLHLGSTDGPIVANGWGSANSWETKHRYRTAERVCPSCNQPTVIKGRPEYGGGWVCFKKKGGCGSKWPDGAVEIEGQNAGRMENPDPFDLDVVLAKMSEKRAYIDATLRATAASGLFTQDIEDVGTPDAPAPREPEQTDDGGLIGKAEIGKGDADFELRQTPDGMALAFKLVSGRGGIKVVALDPIASALKAYQDETIGQRVTCWGRITDETFTANKGKANAHDVTYQVLRLERIQAPGYVLPGPVEAASVPAFKDDELGAMASEVDAVPV